MRDAPSQVKLREHPDLLRRNASKPYLMPMKIIENGNIHEYEELTPEKRPQDRPRNGGQLEFTTLEHGGEYPDTMPQALKVADRRGRACTYVPTAAIGRVIGTNGLPLPPEARPQDPCQDGSGLRFTALSWGTEYADDMPEEIAVTDREGRSCVYVPIRVNGRAVDSRGFTLPRPGEPVPELSTAE
jgi:hypothetical protein